MGNVNKYNRCNFCENKPTFHRIRCSDGDGNEFLCLGWDHFYLDGDKVAKEAKRLGIGVTDVLAMIEAANKLKGKRKGSSAASDSLD